MASGSVRVVRRLWVGGNRARPSSQPQVLATAGSDVFASLLKRPSSRADRYAMGKALRKAVPEEALRLAEPTEGRDPVQLILDSHEGGWTG